MSIMDWLRKVPEEPATEAQVEAPKQVEIRPPTRGEFPAKEFGSWEFFEMEGGQWLGRVYDRSGRHSARMGTYAEVCWWAREALRATKKQEGRQ